MIDHAVASGLLAAGMGKRDLPAMGLADTWVTHVEKQVRYEYNSTSIVYI